MTRRRPLFALALVFALGIAFGNGFELTKFTPVFIVCMALIFAVTALLFAKRQPLWVFGLLALVALLGALRDSWGAPDYAAIEASLNQIEKIEGLVVEYPVRDDTRTSIVVQPDNSTHKIRYLYFHRDREPIPLEYGDLVEISAPLEAPENFGDFDYRAYLHSRGIVATAAIWSPSAIQILEQDQAHPILQFGAELRSRLFISIETHFDAPASGLIKSLLFGDRSELDEQTETAFRDSGVMHVLAVSGLHLGILIGLFFTLLRTCRCTFTLTYILLLPLVLLYLVLVGFKLSLVRAALMLGFATLGWVIAEGGWILRRWIDPLQGLSLAALMILIWTPHALYDVSFQLSFVATAGILLALDLFMPKVREWHQRIEYHWRELRPFWGRFASKVLYAIATLSLISTAAQIAVTPVLGFQFDEIHLTSLAANLAVVPIATITIWIGVAYLISSIIWTQLSMLLSGILAHLLDLLVRLTGFFAQLPGSVVILGSEIQLAALVLLPLLLSWELICWCGWQLARLQLGKSRPERISEKLA